mmetsp:Transcript_15298/g.61510  ORF Transcript_15298/g.61510 Transcript_15298/m.61510 type:complete len:156 (+) Transcript_15298:610-1077(+)
MTGLFTHKGMKRADAAAVVRTMSTYKEFFVNLMMTEELHLREPVGNAASRAATAACCFAVAALAPLFLGDVLESLTFVAGDDSGDEADARVAFHRRAVAAAGLATLGGVGARRARMSLLALKTHALESIGLGVFCVVLPHLLLLALPRAVGWSLF